MVFVDVGFRFFQVWMLNVDLSDSGCWMMCWFFVGLLDLSVWFFGNWVSWFFLDFRILLVFSDSQILSGFSRIGVTVFLRFGFVGSWFFRDLGLFHLLIQICKTEREIGNFFD